MACPSCGCKTVYQHDDDRLQRCAACRATFDLDDHADEGDDDAADRPAVPHPEASVKLAGSSLEGPATGNSNRVNALVQGWRQSEHIGEQGWLP